MFTDKQLQIQKIEHLGVVAGLIDKLKLVEHIDARLSNSELSHVTHGQRIKAMLLNGLGFTQNPIYLTPKFFDEKPIELLIGKGIKAEYLNDDALGRTLDKCYEYGVMRLFAEIANEIYLETFGKEQCQVIHLDTTSFSLQGEYDIDYDDEKVEPPAMPKYGHSKDHRPDLKQMMMSLTVSGDAQMPIWFEPLDGNSQDKKNFHNTLANIKAFREQLKTAPNLSVVADSALYTNGELKKAYYGWITRIPNQIVSIRRLRETDEDDFNWIPLDEDNKAVWLGHTERELPQCNLMVYSKDAAKKQIITLEKQIKEERDSIERASKKLSNNKVYCRADAAQEVENLSKTIKYHNLNYHLIEVTKYLGKGRPSKDVQPEFSHYQLQVSAEASFEKQRPYINKVGRFVLATNQFDLSPTDFLRSYKSQQDVERGFRLIKDPVFHLSNVFLKRPERINALLMVMTFSLMVYNLGQYQFREALKEQNETILNQNKRPTSTPTLRWIFQVLDGINFVTIEGHGDNITGLTTERKKILSLFGSEVCRIYNIV